jgi:hypothetical protein
LQQFKAENEARQQSAIAESQARIAADRAGKSDVKLDESYQDKPDGRHRMIRMQRPDNSQYVIDGGVVAAAPVNPPQPQAPRSAERLAQDKELAALRPPPQGILYQAPDPNNPGNTIPVRVLPNNTTVPIAPPSTGGSLSKPTPQTAAAASKLESAAGDAKTQFGIMQNLIKQKTSAADQDIIVRYFDIVMPVVGRRMNQTELTRLASVGDIKERAKIILQQFGSRELFTDEVRKEITDAARANLEGKQKAWDDFRAEHKLGNALTTPPTDAGATAPPAFTLPNGTVVHLQADGTYK